MKIIDFLESLNVDFYTGVPDSQLKALCNYLSFKYNSDIKHHIIAANEGNACAIATGYNLATGKVPLIYLQNSGLGNIINPYASLLKIYKIPAIFVIGWRGEPDVKDEPQHKFQGEITLQLLKTLNIEYFIVSAETKIEELVQQMKIFNKILAEGKCIAFVIKKGAFSFDKNIVYSNNFNLRRKEVIKHIIKIAEKDLIVSTTGKISRELYEVRNEENLPHNKDFLTVGSMGHCSSIAYGLAINKPDYKVWCIDGDGSAIMHLGAIPTIGASCPNNLIHIILNNNAHESVGGMPTVSNRMNFEELAYACGYKYAKSIDNYDYLDIELKNCKQLNKLCLLEIKCSIHSDKNLSRPVESPIENKEKFIQYISS